MRLEVLVVRDGMRFAEACEILQRNFGFRESRDELWSLLQSFPRRHGLASASEVALEAESLPSGEEAPEERVVAEDRWSIESTVARCLQNRLLDLAPEDRLLLRVIYLDGHKVSVAARLLGVEQRPLYRRLERLHSTLRRHLEEEGVTVEVLRDLLESRGGLRRIDLSEIFPKRPSLSQEGPG